MASTIKVNLNEKVVKDLQKEINSILEGPSSREVKFHLPDWFLITIYNQGVLDAKLDEMLERLLFIEATVDKIDTKVEK